MGSLASQSREEPAAQEVATFDPPADEPSAPSPALPPTQMPMEGVEMSSATSPASSSSVDRAPPSMEDFDDSEDESELTEPDEWGIRRIKRERRPGDTRIRPAYYYPSGTEAKGVPCFEPTEEEFADFNVFVEKIQKYGMASGIVKVKPPASWTRSLPSVSEPLSEVRLRDPIAQNFLGSSGLYRVANVGKSKIWNAKQWKDAADGPKFATPDFFKPNARNSAKSRLGGIAKEQSEAPSSDAEQPADSEVKVEHGVATGSQHSGLGTVNDDQQPATPKPAPAPRVAGFDAAAIIAARRKQTNLGRADISPGEWDAWEGEWLRLPHNARPEDYTVEACQEIERAYWRTLTFGEPPMYGADMKGSLFTAETTSWNVADLRDLLARLGSYHCIPGVNTPYLYFGMWRATFAWHVEDADLYSINYIHFGAPKLWYSVPQNQAEKFERVMGGWFPQERGKCREFLRHKSYLASPKKLANEGIMLNKVVQLPGEFVLTFPFGYHSGFNVGFNCAESINFANESWIEIGRKAKPCACVTDSVKIDVDEWLRAAEVGAQTRKRAIHEPWFARPKRPKIDYSDPAAAMKKAAAAAKKAAKAEAARLAALREPFICALCPDMTEDTLVPLAPPARGARLSAEQLARRKPGKAHKACVMYVPSTYIDVDQDTGEEMVYGFEGIEKDRWKLKCQLCDDKHGCPVQCTKSDKCVRAQHVTCALREESGVLMDAFLTTDGLEISLIAPEEAGPPQPSPFAEGNVRLAVHCRTHNPAWQKLQTDRKAAQLAADVARIAPGSRLRIRAGGSAFEVLLVTSRPEAAAIDVVFEDGKRSTIKTTQIVWQPTATGSVTPAGWQRQQPYADAFVYDHAARSAAGRGDRIEARAAAREPAVFAPALPGLPLLPAAAPVSLPPSHNVMSLANLIDHPQEALAQANQD